MLIMKNSKIVACIFLLLISISVNIPAQEADTSAAAPADTIVIEEPMIGDVRAGNFSPSVHVIKPIDENGFVIHEADDIHMPFSTRTTCGECHSYDTILEGMHFNNGRGQDSPGRKSEPYIYFDPYTLTVLPLSYKEWQGTVHPESIGMTTMKFLDMFGSHYPGGILSQDESLENPDNYFRWEVSGKLDINCLICHDADPAFDAAEYSAQILKQNYRWAAAASSALAEVKGSAKGMPDNFDPFNTNTFADVDLRTNPPPTAIYDFSRFNSDNKVFFDIERAVPDQRCYYCHSSVVSDQEELFLHNKEDVHLKAGMACVDCHRNDLKHDMIKGYDSEWREKGNPSLKAYSCEGCHVGDEEADTPVAGNFGAPVPAHKGIPSIHFERMTCTACHAGEWPAEKTKLVKTSRAHKLGAHFAFKADSAYPHIQSSVYVNNEFDKIELSNSLWKSYWAVKSGTDIKPMDLEALETRVRPLLDLDSLLSAGIIPKISDSLLTLVLADLNSAQNTEGEVVYISGNMQAGLDASGELKVSQVDETEAYNWPVGHTVRPASQSLGIRGCDDCHTYNSEFFFGNVEGESFIESAPAASISMTQFMGSGTFYNKFFSLSFLFRPALKFLIIISCALIALTVMVFLGRSILTFSRYAAAESALKQDKSDL